MLQYLVACLAVLPQITLSFLLFHVVILIYFLVFKYNFLTSTVLYL